MMPHGGRWRAPSVSTALAGFVHDGQSAADHERDDDNASCYGSVHCNLPGGSSLPIINA